MVVPANPIAVQPRRRLFDVAEYYSMGAAGIFGPEERVELIEGQILEMYPRGVRHIWSVSDLSGMFARRDDVIPSVFNPLRLGDRSEPVPDVTVLRGETPQDRHPSPEYAHLVVEVADVSFDYDQQIKAPLYGRAGIPEYWIVDLNGERIEVYREPSPSGYRAIRFYQRGQSLSPAFAPDMVIQVDAILGPPAESAAE
jgi:Uma2 family endonuclease